jgi:hypothetical protein
MKSNQQSAIVRAGDYRGLGRLYSNQGELILRVGESVLKAASGWDIDVMSPWRQVLPHVVFEGFGGVAKSRLYITTERIVLVREIDLWRQLKGEMTPLGLPNAAVKEAQLKRLLAAGARQFCEIWPQNLRVVRAKVTNRRRSWMDLQLMGVDRKQYAITIWKTDGKDPETLDLLNSRFPRAERETAHSSRARVPRHV